MFKRHILLSETGWRGIRELSISLLLRKIPSSVLIKGMPDKQVRQMITRHDGIKNLFIPEKVFSLYAYMYILMCVFMKRRLFLAVEGKNKTFSRLANLRKIFPSIELIRIKG